MTFSPKRRCAASCARCWRTRRRKGLPGEHHFKITFNTTAPGVRLSERMRARYPEEMTIVLQHQFWDLIVTEQGFEVGLSFGGIPERVGVPFDAVTAFYDPAVQFGFQFETIEAAAGRRCRREGRRKNRRARSTGQSRKAWPLRSCASRDARAPAPPDSGAGGEVVRLDRFRKK